MSLLSTYYQCPWCRRLFQFPDSIRAGDHHPGCCNGCGHLISVGRNMNGQPEVNKASKEWLDQFKSRTEIRDMQEKTHHDNGHWG